MNINDFLMFNDYVDRDGVIVVVVLVPSSMIDIGTKGTHNFVRSHQKNLWGTH